MEDLIYLQVVCVITTYKSLGRFRYKMAFPFQNIERSHSAVSSMDVMIKGLEKPQKSTDDNDLVWMDDTLRCCAQRASDHEGKLASLTWGKR